MSGHEDHGPDPDELGEQIRAQVERGLRRGMRHGIRRGIGSWSFGFDADAEGGAEVSDTEERRFTVAGMPKVQLGNVSGETNVTVGEADEVFVRARKHVRGWSEERARRLLENVEIRMEQHGDQIVVEPRLFEQERGWLDLFRGGRVGVDLEVRVPRETQLLVRGVSGDVDVAGLRGPIELQTVSGEIDVTDVQGPMRVRTVSGDIDIGSYAGRLEANSTSGDVDVVRSRVRMPDVVTVSGDIDIDAVYLAEMSGEPRLKTVSGDVELALGDANAEIEFRTVSGDADVEIPARVEKEGRRDRRIFVGAGGPRLRVKSVSGDLKVRAARETPVEAEPQASAEQPAYPAEARAEAPAAPGAREILERLANGEIGVDEAAAALDARRSA